MRISDWSSDVCSSDLSGEGMCHRAIKLPVGKRGIPRLSGARTAGGFGGIASASLIFAGIQRTCENEQGTRSEEHTSELQSLMRISYAVFGLKNKKSRPQTTKTQYL